MYRRRVGKCISIHIASFSGKKSEKQSRLYSRVKQNKFDMPNNQCIFHFNKVSRLTYMEMGRAGPSAVLGGSSLTAALQRPPVDSHSILSSSYEHNNIKITCCLPQSPRPIIPRLAQSIICHHNWNNSSILPISCSSICRAPAIYLPRSWSFIYRAYSRLNCWIN